MIIASFKEYRTQVLSSISDDMIYKQVAALKPAGKFERDNTSLSFKPKPYRGYSIITTPFLEDKCNSNRDCYQQLAQVQRTFFEHLEPQIFAPVPTSSFHLTIAALVYGDEYEKSIHTIGDEIRLRKGPKQDSV